MIEQLKNASTINQGLFVAVVGLVGVFVVLVAFFLAILLLQKIETKKKD